MTRTILGLLALVLLSLPLKAELIGFFPGLDALIARSDAIVILRVDREMLAEHGTGTLYSMYDCFIYQTLKGEIPNNSLIRLQLMDTRTSFVSPYARHSTHLIFLTRKRADNEPTEYRTIEFRGANTRLTPFGHEKMPDGNSLEEKIRTLLKISMEYNKSQFETEHQFLDLMMKGSAEPSDGSIGR
jgi:hypothetical protein